jgi:lipopolysaccharide biosynthesis regulator YciM
MGRATKGAAKILLGKVYLTKREYQNAVDKLAEVIDNEVAYGYGLHDNYGTNWKVATEMLVRTGRFVDMKAHGMTEASLAESNKTEISANISERHTLYPIPQRGIDLNKTF